MASLERQIDVARGRLWLNTLFACSATAFLVAAGAFVLLVIVERTLHVGIPIWLVAAALAGVALVAALLTALARRATPLAAATAVDQAVGLKERLSTAWLVRERTGDAFARAVVADAQKTAGGVHVPSHIPLRSPAQLPWTVAVTVAALVLGYFLPSFDLFSGRTAAARDAQTAQATQSERVALQSELQQQLNKVREMAKDNAALADLAADLKPIELPESADLKPEDIRREAVKKVDEIRKSLEEKLQSGELEGLRSTQKKLEKIEPQKGNDAAAKLSQALANNDATAAKQALQEMQQQLEESMKQEGNPEAQQKLAEMTGKLQKLADQIAELSDTVRIQKDLEKAGLSPDQAKQLAEQMKKMDPKEIEKQLQQQLGENGMTQKQMQDLVQKMQKQMQSQQQLNQLQQSLSEAAQAMQQCNNPGNQGNQQAGQNASKALSDAMGQMSQMEMAEQAMSELQAQMSQLDNMRQGMCQGQGQGDGGQGQGENGRGGMGQGPGMYGGYGQAYGERSAKEKGAHTMKSEKAKLNVTKGQIIGQMLVDGPQERGEVSTAVRDVLVSAQRDAEDAIERHAVPRQYERMTREYFEKLAGLSREGQASPAKPPAKAEKKPAPR